MSQIQLYVDEDAAEQAVVDGLRQRGVDVRTVFEVGLNELPDEEQLEFAVANGFALYSLNVGDFARLHQEYLRSGMTHSGILVIPRQRYSIGEKIRRLVAFVTSTTAEEMRDRFEFL